MSLFLGLRVLSLFTVCSAESERYRNTLRRRDQEIKDFQDAAALQNIEGTKWAREQTNYEERIAYLENELIVAQQAQVQLDEQKQENMMLKETIDRMRFDMDEMRNSAASAHLTLGGSGNSSAPGSVSKSLGAELLSKMKDNKWGMDEDDEDEDEVSRELAALQEAAEEDDTDGEDVIQTIITRTKRVSLKCLCLRGRHVFNVICDIESRESRKDVRDHQGRRGQGVLRHRDPARHIRVYARRRDANRL